MPHLGRRERRSRSRRGGNPVRRPARRPALRTNRTRLRRRAPRGVVPLARGPVGALAPLEEEVARLHPRPLGVGGGGGLRRGCRDVPGEMRLGGTRRLGRRSMGERLVGLVGQLLRGLSELLSLFPSEDLGVERDLVLSLPGTRCGGSEEGSYLRLIDLCIT